MGTLRSDARNPPVPVLTTPLGAKLAALTLLAAATATAPAMATGLVRSRSALVHGQFQDMRVDASGSVRVATTSFSRGSDRVSALVTRVTPGHTAAPRTTILPPTNALRSDLPSILTPTGAVSAYRTRGAGRTMIDTVTAQTGRRAGKPQRVSAAGRLANEPVLYAGGGTVMVLYTARQVGGKPQTTVTVRPRGGRSFGHPVALGQPGEDLDDVRYTAAFGPSGDGAIVQTPVFQDTPIRLRRVAADGTVGPWIDIAPGPYEDSFADLAVAKDGTIAVALVATPSNQATTDGDPLAYLVTTSLPAGSSMATPVQTLEPVDDGIVAEDSFGVSIGKGDEVLVTCASGQAVGDDGDAGQVDVFGGPAAALVQRASWTQIGPSFATGVARPDGGATVVWQASENRGFTTMIVGAQANPNGRFGRPQILARSVFHDTKRDVAGTVEPQSLQPLGGARTVLAYSDESNDRARLSVVSLRPAGAP